MRDLLQRGRAMWSEFSKIGTATYASSISYFMFLSLVPLLVICISLLTIVGISEQEVVTFLSALLPDTLDGLVAALVSDAYDRSGIAFSLSTITLLWSASKGAKALRVGLNAAYAQEETRSAIVVVAISIVVGLIIDLLIAATMYLVFRGSVLHALAGTIEGLQEQNLIFTILNSLATLALGTVTLMAAYAYLPTGKRSFRAQLPGAVCATLACGMLSYGFCIYVDNFSNYTMLYGSIATVAILLLWMYLISFILMVGGFINRDRNAKHDDVKA